ncbi:hypothetical protein M0802_016172 [Mischocyttarus mexicanus]|nr:hypothetical protein M0802_016172 [Mischocyttarus mexicanus]
MKDRIGRFSVSGACSADRVSSRTSVLRLVFFPCLVWRHCRALLPWYNVETRWVSVYGHNGRLLRRYNARGRPLVT